MGEYGVGRDGVSIGSTQGIDTGEHRGGRQTLARVKQGKAQGTESTVQKRQQAMSPWRWAAEQTVDSDRHLMPWVSRRTHADCDHVIASKSFAQCEDYGNERLNLKGQRYSLRFPSEGAQHVQRARQRDQERRRGGSSDDGSDSTGFSASMMHASGMALGPHRRAAPQGVTRWTAACGAAMCASPVSVDGGGGGRRATAGRKSKIHGYVNKRRGGGGVL
ncbi:hypothetical protein GGX14DRAFT_388597 [Mycena pura]|uniref:Uncharacterized protein n=1 Tax=Mycena pura TaxID=153505 RepID=A0AAD6YKN1_9AGAR|nr:hypothetical protein GGX14DRAFT_388597 [Mycena pura]